MAVSETYIWNIDQVKKQETSVVIDFAVRNLPKKIEEMARTIDGVKFAPDCFGFTMAYNIGTKTYTIETKEQGKEIYYIDDDGERHYLEYTIPHGTVRSAKGKIYQKAKLLLGINRKKRSKIKKKKPETKKNKTTPLTCKEHEKIKGCLTGQMVLF